MSKKFADKHRSKKKEAVPLTKAGVMLYEDTPEGRELFVGYNEGRFSKNGRLLVLPKGSIDPGETPLMGGLREFGEETGFPLIDNPHRGLKGFLSAEHIAKLERGETLEHITNPDYPGIEIVKFVPHAYPHEYHARHGQINSMVMFGAEVKGLNAIATHETIKNREGKTTKDLLNANRDIPRFDTFLKWMYAGAIPADGDLPEVKLCDPVWMMEKIRQYQPKQYTGESTDEWQRTREIWQKFCEKMEHDPEYPKLRNSFKAIKKRMEDKGFVEGDNAVLKFDEKDCPLFWYVEGATHGLARPLLAKIFTDMEACPDYARAHGGRGTKFSDLRKHQTMKLGQIAGFTPFVSKEDWLGACTDAGEKRRVGHAFVHQGNQMRERAIILPLSAASGMGR